MIEKGKSIPKEPGTYKNRIGEIMREQGYVYGDNTLNYGAFAKLLEGTNGQRFTANQVRYLVEGQRWPSPETMMKLEAVVSWLEGSDAKISDIYSGWGAGVARYKEALG